MADTKPAAALPVPPVTLKFSLRRWLSDRYYYFIAFFAPVLILFAAYMLFGVYPAGDESVLVLDLNGQYVYYYENLRDILRGDGSPFISWSRNLSGEIMGIFAYYLASPFVLIVMLLPRSMITESLLIMQLCKVGTAGVTFCFYMRNSKRLSVKTSVIFSVMYSLMAYMIVQLMNPMWLDGLIYLPLVCKGIETVIDGGNELYMIIPLALMFMAHFYIGWMMAFFSVLYFFFYYFSGKQDARFRFGHFVKSGLLFAASGITAALIACWILVPLYYSLKLGKFDFTDPKFEWKTQFDFLDFFRNLLPNVYDTCRPEGSPSIYCGMLTVVLLPLYFMNTRIDMRHKIGSGLLALSLILSMYISNIDIAWHGMQVPNWLPYRYSFMFSFVLLVIAAQAFEELEGITVKEIGGVFFGLIVYIFYIDKQKIESINVVTAIWYSVLLTALYCLALYLYRNRRIMSKGAVIFVSIVMSLEMLGSTLYNIIAIDKDVTYSKYSSYNNYISLGRETVSELYETDDDVYRIESDYHRTVNDAMALGSYGLSHSSSTLNSKPIQFLRKLGFSYGGHYIKYKGATYVTDAIFGIKYVMERSKTDDEEIASSKHYDKLVLTKSNDKNIINVYENPYALPIGFMVNSAAADCVIEDTTNPFENQNKLLSSMLSETEQNFFRRVWVDEIVPENVKESASGAHKKFTTVKEGENSQVEFLLEAPNENMMYLYMPSSYERKVNMWLNKEFLDYYYESGKMVIQTLGRFERGEQISLIATIANDKNELYFKDALFYYLREDKFAEAIETLKQHPLEISSFAEDHIVGTITAEEDGIMFTSITNEPGWTILVDGVETEPVELYNAVIGVPLTAGTHSIEMKFFPQGLSTGIMLSAAGLLIMVIIILLEYNSDKKLIGKLAGASEAAAQGEASAEGESQTVSDSENAPVSDETPQPPPEAPPIQADTDIIVTENNDTAE